MTSHFPFSSLYCTIRESVTGIVRKNQDFPCLGASRNFLTPSLPCCWDPGTVTPYTSHQRCVVAHCAARSEDSWESLN